MRKSALFVGFLAAFAVSAFAASEKRTGYEIQAELIMKNGKEIRKTKDQSILGDEIRSWVKLTQDEDNLLLLGRLQEKGPKSLQFEFVVLDTASKTKNIINLPVIQLPVGTPYETSVAVEGRGVAQVKLLARPVQYSRDY